MVWWFVCGPSRQKFPGIDLADAVCLVLDISLIRQTMLVNSNVKMVLKLLQLLVLLLSKLERSKSGPA
jgi:hypothetical protein